MFAALADDVYRKQMTVAGTHKTIPEIQYLRMIAVLLVAIAHLYQANVRFFPQPLLGDFAYAGFAGVDVFFVVSGFIIHHLYSRKAAPGWRYYVNRLNRILPLYWFFTALAVAGYWVMGDSLTSDIGELDIWSSLLLLPTGAPPILVIGWTLTHELYFYLAFGLMMLAPPAMRGWAAGVWAGASVIMALQSEPLASPWLTLIFSPFNLLFLTGTMLSAHYRHLDRFRWPLLALAIAGAGLAMVWTGSQGLAGIENRTIRVAIFLPFAVGLSGSLLAWAPRWPKLAARIGDWSYSIYLSHILVIGVMARLLATAAAERAWSGWLLYPACLAACLLVGAVSHYGVERPILLRLKSLINQTRTAAPAREAD
ncbi:acyltransferase family protein [Maricaulis sp.]|uniref:acyltransferase family protein n=1 Tax=Maricaulis sp. TaxID=1486257 RepID=UPI003A94A856